MVVAFPREDANSSTIFFHWHHNLLVGPVPKVVPGVAEEVPWQLVHVQHHQHIAWPS